MSTTNAKSLLSSRQSYSSRSNANLFEPVRSPHSRTNSLSKNNSYGDKSRKSTDNNIRENTRGHLNTDRPGLKNETPGILTLRETTTRMTNESPFNGVNYGYDHGYNENGNGGGYPEEAYNFSSEKQMKKFLVEISSLQKELSVKDVLIEKLMKENGNLRKEMEEFLTAVDEAREYIDLELQESNQKIKDLETELEEARDEVRKYKEMLKRNNRQENNDSAPGATKVTMKKLGMEVNNYYSLAQRETEAFYNQLNEQIFGFLNHSKRQFNNFSQNVQERFSQEEEQEETAPMVSLPLFSLGSNLQKLQRDEQEEMVHTEGTPRHENDRPSPIERNEAMNVSINSLKGSGSMTSLNSLRKNSSKKNFDTNHSEELLLAHESNKSLKKKKDDFLSGGHNVETSPETANFGSNLSAGIGGGKGNLKDSLSPKSSLLRAKLRSDAILQEMKKKLAESTPH